ncbi:MAG: signal peptidase II [Opitutales bacterium]|nr:signal peptidase II [Opitutales bacterium]
MLSISQRPENPAKATSLSWLSWRFVLTMLFTFALDRLTKLAVIRLMPVDESSQNASSVVEIISGYFSIVHVTNHGAAWGILSGQTYLLCSIAIVTIACLWSFRRELGLSHPVMQYAMGFFVGGILGNLFDRVYYGCVVDFLDVVIPFANYRWPAFNIADCGIFIGVAAYIVASIAIERREKKERKSGREKFEGNK